MLKKKVCRQDWHLWQLSLMRNAGLYGQAVHRLPKVQQRTPYICTDSVGGGWVANLVESHGGFQTRRQMEPRAKRTARRDGRFCQYHPCRSSPTTLSGRDLCGKDAQSFTKNKPLTCHCWTLNPCVQYPCPGTASGRLWPLPGHSWPLLAISWTLLAPLAAPWPPLVTSGPSLASSGCSWPLLAIPELT